MTQDEDANGVTLHTEQKMVGKAPEVGASQVAIDGMKPGGVFQGQCDISHELSVEGIAESGSAGFIIG